MKRLGTWASVVASCATAACLVISPLDDPLRGDPGQAGGDSGLPDGGSGGSGGGSCGESSACETHAQCGTNDEPGRCVDGCCVALRTEHCRCVPQVVQHAWSDPDSILIAAFAPLLPNAEDCGTESVSVNYRLAVEELNAPSIKDAEGKAVEWGGLPTADPLNRRPIALLLCDNYGHPEHAAFMDFGDRLSAAEAAAEHVTTKLKVPAVIAMLEPDILQKVFATHGLAKNVFFLDPHGPTNALAAMPQTEKGKLLWHMLGKPSDFVATYEAMLPRIAERARSQADELFEKDDKLKVALLVDSDVFWQQFADALAEGLPAVLESGAELVVKTVPASQSEYPNFYAEILAFEPQIVISAMDYRIFQIWDALDSDGWRPYFIFSPRNIGEVAASGFTGKLKGAIGVGQDYLLERVLGVSAAGSEDADLLNEYRKRLFKLAANLGVSVEPGENYYDAIYYLTYAMVGATGADTPPGSQIGHVGMNDIMLGSQRHQVGPDGIYASVDSLMNAGKIQLEGTSGDGLFDTQTGVRIATGAVYCFSRAASNELQLVDHVLHYDLDQAALRRAKQYQDEPGEPLPCADFLDPE